jgi:hypothetical protein
MQNPYQSLTPEKFWKTGVTNVAAGELFDGLWAPKQPIDKDSKILTAGSCFAQHISRWLIANGYQWIESETVPAGLSIEERKEAGYGVFSFRTGNIYSPALLRQWVAQAFGHQTPTDDIFVENGRYFDPLRPAIPLKGFDSAEQLQTARAATLSAFRDSIAQANIFVFTLGLTEAWTHVDGTVYPVCPGTVKGVFDPAQHQFINYSHAAIVADMGWIIERLREVNPQMRFILTVSPVPLTATATDSHVLTATNYSKAVLRSAAGELSATYDFVDYFPSYELITSYATRQNFYEDNLRSVRSEGVEYVMAHFSRGISAGSPVATDPAKTTKHTSPKTAPSTVEEICEDILLESWNAQGEKPLETSLCLLGDSHMGMLSKALNHMSIPHHGGMIMNGSAWTSNLLHLDQDEFFVPLEDVSARERWKQTLPFFKSPSRGKRIVVNIGMQTHRSVHFLINYLNSSQKSEFTDAAFRSYFEQENKVKLQLIKNLIKAGYSLLAISDPPTRSVNPKINQMIDYWIYYDRESLKMLKEIGCSTFNAGLYFSGDKFKSEYFSKVVLANGQRHWYHGSDQYYQALAQKVVDIFVKPS